jgi:hypothetical protein
MLKRRKGYILLLLLVLTGLAGRLSTTTITNKERRLIIVELKETKAAVLKSVKGLSEKQLNFKRNGHLSIKECLQQLTLSEQGLWSMADRVLKQPEQKPRLKPSDERALFLLNDSKTGQQIPKNLQRTPATWKNTEQLIDAFKTNRNELIKFAKTSTANMRNHVLQVPGGAIDSYQMILYITENTRRHILKIEEIKAGPSFPK